MSAGGTTFTLPERLGPAGLRVDDLNDAVEDGWYTATSTALNLPVSTGVGEVFVERNVGTDLRQTFHRIYASVGILPLRDGVTVSGANQDLRKWYRTRYQGVWSDWYLDDPQTQERASTWRVQSAAQTITRNTWTAIKYDKVLDIESNMTWDAGLASLTANVAGVYVINAQVGLAANPDGRRLIRTRVTGVSTVYQQLEIAPVSSQATILPASITVPLAAGAKLQVEVYQGAAGDLDTRPNPNESFLTVARVSR